MPRRGCAAAVAAAAAAAAAPPPLPVWPPRFSSAWTSPEYPAWSPDSRGKATSGRYAVDSAPSDGRGASERIDLLDGSRDHLCQRFYNQTPCTQLTTQGFRFLYFPRENDCCRCCTYAAGTYLCGGPIGPQWVNNATGNIRYEGRVLVNGTYSCDKWRVVGVLPPPLPTNYYYSDAGTGRPCEIDGYNYLRTPLQRADDLYVFDPTSWTDSVDPSVFDVPAVCDGSRYCATGVCATGPN